MNEPTLARRTGRAARGTAPYRSRRDRIVSGTAAGLAEAIGVDPLVVRTSFGVLSLAGGAGVLLYALAWAVMPEPPERYLPRPGRGGLRPVMGVACITAGLLVLLRSVGWWFGDAIVWPVALACLGAAVILGRDDEGSAERRALLDPRAVITRGATPLRVVAGALLVGAGITAFFAVADVGFSIVAGAIVPVAITVGGLVLIFGPWLLRLAGQLAEERRERIRSEERAEVAAHLHDSVLQTLALIQRADSSRRMASLARAQERELRGWLYGKSRVEHGDSLSAAVDALAARAEALHEVPVETIVVGEADLDDALAALVHACGEAIVNAARHSGSPTISVYVEVEPHAVTAYVRDQGKGFDLALVPPDRRGIAGSIVGRVERVGGTVTITTAVSEGTEVMMTVPRGVG